MNANAAPPLDAEYDVAVSFRAGDLQLAEQLGSLLQPALRAFVFSRRQEEIALGDGMDAFRGVFLRTPISLVLYRDGWGRTPWTQVEQAAIRDRCLEQGYRNLALVRLDQSPLPDWVPHTHIAFDVSQYPIEQLIGAIKRKAQTDFGVTIAPESPIVRAQRQAAEAAYEEETEEYFRTIDGLNAVRACVRAAFQALCTHAQTFTNQQLGWAPQSGTDNTQAVARLGGMTVQLLYQQMYANRTVPLRLRRFDGILALPNTSEYSFHPPRELGSIKYTAARTPMLGVCFATSDGRLLTGEQVGEEAAAALVELATRESERRRR